MVSAAAVALSFAVFGQEAPKRAAPISPVPSTAPATLPAATTAATSDLGFIFARPTTLSLPAGVSGARLSAIPDSLLNDQPAARFRVPVRVRGTVGLTASDGPAVVAWSEGGFWYELASTGLTVPQLIDLASALR